MAEYEVLLEQARIQVAQQEASLDLIRTRATAVLSIAGVVAALFAPHYLRRGDVWAYWAVGALVLTMFPAVWIHLPTDWAIGVQLDRYPKWIEDVRTWRREHAPESPDLTNQLTEEFASVLVGAYVSNGNKYPRLARAYVVEFGLLIVQALLWVVAVIPR
ncbi:MAG: hypothetical protein IVW52_09110 [Acidimicrobiales bacterium]|nr:hypothetical protein [Acidimicrobiales bacterium]